MHKGDFIETASGWLFYPLDPRPEDINITDIASALSKLCRFTGHCRTFYSVAQHSVLCADYASPAAKLAALLHDAAEAYIGDMARPMKRMFREMGILAFDTIEAGIMAAIHEKFNVNLTPEIAAEVKAIDSRMLRTEARDLMVSGGATWVNDDTVKPYPVTITPFSPISARYDFMQTFIHLTRG